MEYIINGRGGHSIENYSRNARLSLRASTGLEVQRRHQRAPFLQMLLMIDLRRSQPHLFQWGRQWGVREELRVGLGRRDNAGSRGQRRLRWPSSFSWTIAALREQTPLDIVVGVELDDGSRDAIRGLLLGLLGGELIDLQTKRFH
jgi:hypothetical protein